MSSKLLKDGIMTKMTIMTADVIVLFLAAVKKKSGGKTVNAVYIKKAWPSPWRLRPERSRLSSQDWILYRGYAPCPQTHRYLSLAV